MATILELWRYPVKSLRGERIERATIAPKIAGDREWGIFDASTGKLLSAKSVGALLMASARYDNASATTTIELPDGATVTAGEAAASAALSSFLDRAVTLRRAAPAEVSTIDMEMLDGGMESIETQPGSLYDSRSVLHLISTSTLAALPASELRRYRPNILIADADEDSWVDRNVALGGSVRAHVRKRTERCIIVTRAQPGLPAEPALLRTLKQTRDSRVGVYLDPSSHGPIAAGDVVTVI